MEMTKEQHYMAYHEARQNYQDEKVYIQVLRKNWLTEVNIAKAERKIEEGRAIAQSYMKKIEEAESRKEAYWREASAHFDEWNAVV